MKKEKVYRSGCMGYTVRVEESEEETESLKPDYLPSKVENLPDPSKLEILPDPTKEQGNNPHPEKLEKLIREKT